MFIFPCLVCPGGWTLGSAHLKKGKKAPGEKLPALTPVPDNAECGKNLANLSKRSAASANRRFSSSKRSQLLIWHAQRNAFRRRDARLQSRSFARWNQSLRRSPNSNRLC